MNLMSIDVTQVGQFLTFVNNCWSVPLKIVAALAFLWHYLGPSCLALVVIMLSSILASTCIWHYCDKFQVRDETKCIMQTSASMSQIYAYRTDLYATNHNELNYLESINFKYFVIIWLYLLGKNCNNYLITFGSTKIACNHYFFPSRF